MRSRRFSPAVLLLLSGLLPALSADGIDSIRSPVAGISAIAIDGGLTGANQQCPPCFNCNLPVDACRNFASCSALNGQCSCPSNFGGLDCATPSASDQQMYILISSVRFARVAQSTAAAKEPDGLRVRRRMDGNDLLWFVWLIRAECPISTVCARDDVCAAIVDSSGFNATCYSGFVTVQHPHHACTIESTR
jgi:hypothetical protein